LNLRRVEDNLPSVKENAMLDTIARIWRHIRNPDEEPLTDEDENFVMALQGSVAGFVTAIALIPFLDGFSRLLAKSLTN